MGEKRNGAIFDLALEEAWERRQECLRSQGEPIFFIQWHRPVCAKSTIALAN
jgi:hypothetical protein